MPDPEELRFLGQLVHRGQLQKEQAQALLEESHRSGRSLFEAAVRQGLFTRERLEFLQKVEGESVPEIPGFEVLGIAGRGGTAIVLHSRERKSGREVAVKVLRVEQTDNDLARQSFLREANLLIKLQHENVVKGEKVGTFQGRMIFLMEWVPGRSVQDLLREGLAFDEDAALFIVLQVARALSYLSDQGVVHRDIKPGNVLLTRQNQVKLIDLGFASSGETPRDADETTQGTAAYISPEQARGLGDVDVRSDIYSLGATLYQLAVGELPFSGRTSQEILAAQILESLNSEAMHDRRISPHMRYFIEKMMAKEREIRYQSPKELIADIEEQIRGKKSLQFRPDRSQDEELLRKPYEEGERKPDRPRRRRP